MLLAITRKSGLNLSEIWAIALFPGLYCKLRLC
jgi:hypothetical protein